MSDKKQFLERERAVYGKLYADITYAIDNISPFLERDELNKRKYVKRNEVLRQYVELIDASEAESAKGGFLSFLKTDNSLDLLQDYKQRNSESISQLENCARCGCLKCSSPCTFDSCAGCRTKSHIANCDHNKINVTIHNGFYLDLTNDRTGMPDKYRVLATLQNCTEDKKYIIIQSIAQGDKFVLYYYPGIAEDSYGEISNPDEFDLVVNTYENNAV